MTDPAGALQFAAQRPTLVHILRDRARGEPRRVAFRFLADSPSDSDAVDEWTYRELDARARAVAECLHAIGPAGERALLVYPPGLPFIAALFGCFYAGWIAVPTVPPSAGQRRERLDGIVHDAQPRVVLTTLSLRDRVRTALSSSRASSANDPSRTTRADGRMHTPASDSDRTLVATDTISPRESACEGARDAGECAGDGEAIHVPAPQTVALLQYTSGSTGRPRGVVLSHANLMHNLQQIARRFGMHADSRGVNWLPPYHDMGLIGAILECVAVGCRGTLMTPLSMLRRPARWLEAMSRERGTISGGPNFAYDLCVERVTPEERSRLDLSSWEVAFVGAEPVRSATLERFAATFAECGFRREALYPCYGLAEATLMVAGGERLGGFRSRTYAGRGVVSCGRPIEGAELRILDAATGARCPDGAVGEITLGGPSVARGYWGSIVEGEADFSSTRWLRTGDLGFVAQGELYITGRSKAVIIVNGRKVHAEDIEQTVTESHVRGWPGGVAAVGVDPGAGSEALLVFQEIDWRRTGALGPADLERTIRAAIAVQHQLAVARVVLLRPGQIPRTSSGKVRRDVLRDMYLAGRLT